MFRKQARPSHRTEVIAFSAFFSLSFILQSCSGRPSNESPKLAVLIAVDQMRGDFPDHYSPAFSSGLRRIFDEGLWFAEAMHDHSTTHTAPGHATLATGVTPSRSGIIANSWQRRVGEEWSSMYAVADEDSPLVGLPDGWPSEEGRSPRNLERDGLADWVLARDPSARAVAISGKDRAAITLGGHAGEAYWIVKAAGSFVTSTYYSDTLPGWVARFNEHEMPRMAADTVWESLVWPEVANLARADSASYENYGRSSVFPHRSWGEVDGSDPSDHRDWVFYTPVADEAVLELAKMAVHELRLGGRGTVDYLGISLSATDYVGHAFGPLSQEQLSNLIHLDRALGEFFDYLDEEVGSGRWTLVLTSDHGVATMPEAVVDMGIGDARRLDPEEESAAVLDVYREAADQGGDTEAVAARAARLLVERGLVEHAYSHSEILNAPSSDSLARVLRHSWHADRAPHLLSTQEVEIVRRAGDLTFGASGTTHGTPHHYDRWVPIVLLGPGIEGGRRDDPVRTVDVAPTLAALAGVTVPDDLDGLSLVSVGVEGDVR